jgi:DNA modification methylase
MERDAIRNQTICGDARTVLPTLPAGCIDCIVTSPPYYKQRDYDHAEQIGN